MAKIIHVNAGRGYDIHLGHGILDKSGELVAAVTKARRAAVITDSNVGPIYGSRVKEGLEAAGFAAPLFTFPAGETSKNHETLLSIYSFLARCGITRSDILIALGGGVVGDVAGFAAATWQRGIDFVQIPTTLLAQVDSSIGGKTAVDLKEGKNLVGAFWQPSLVICDPDTLGTLDARNFSCGMAEVVKHACIRSRALFGQLSSCHGIADITENIIEQNLAIKRAVVEQDEREKGERMLLNFGHTLGHAIEKLTLFKRYTHGEAVAMGMSLIAEYGERNGLTAPGAAGKMTGLLSQFGLPVNCPIPIMKIVRAAMNDKKRSGGNISLVLLRDIGDAYLYRIPVCDMRKFFSDNLI